MHINHRESDIAMCRILAGKNILVGVCGSIAAFKVAGWVSALAKAEARVSVIMTESACNFVAPLTFQSLSGRPVMSGMFEETSPDGMAHIELGQQTDLFIIAPATANTIAKLARGLADDLLTAAALVNRSQLLIFPAMNPAMYEHPATRKNLATLVEYGYTVIDPDDGMMACKSKGKGRLPEWDDAQEIILSSLSPKDLVGKSPYYSRANQRTFGPRKIYQQQKFRENGLCPCTNCQKKRRGCNADQWTDVNSCATRGSLQKSGNCR